MEKLENETGIGNHEVGASINRKKKLLSGHSQFFDVNEKHKNISMLVNKASKFQHRKSVEMVKYC